MHHLEVSGAVRHIYLSLGFKSLMMHGHMNLKWKSILRYNGNL